MKRNSDRPSPSSSSQSPLSQSSIPRPSESKSAGSLKSLSQGIDVLKLLALEGPMRNRELAEKLGLSRPTITRIVQTLEQQGLVMRSLRNENISLDMGAAVIGYAYNHQSLLVREAYPVMVRFRRETGISIALTAIDRMTGKGVYLVGLEDDAVADYPGDVGSLYSLLELAPGRVHLTKLNTLERDRLLKRMRHRYSDLEWQVLMQKMEEDREFFNREGYGRSFGEVAPSLNMLFVGVDVPGKAVFSLTCLAPQVQMDETSAAEKYGPALKMAVLEIERRVRQASQ